MKAVIFIKDFAKKKKGDEGRYDSLLASRLVHKDKVAKYKPVEEPAGENSVSDALKEAKGKLKASDKKTELAEGKLKKALEKIKQLEGKLKAK